MSSYSASLIMFLIILVHLEVFLGKLNFSEECNGNNFKGKSKEIQRFSDCDSLWYLFGPLRKILDQNLANAHRHISLSPWPSAFCRMRVSSTPCVFQSFIWSHPQGLKMTVRIYIQGDIVDFY